MIAQKQEQEQDLIRKVTEVIVAMEALERDMNRGGAEWEVKMRGHDDRHDQNHSDSDDAPVATADETETDTDTETQRVNPAHKRPSIFGPLELTAVPVKAYVPRFEAEGVMEG